MDVGDNTTTGNSGLDEGVELLVATNGQLKVTGSDTLDLQVLGCVTGELKNLSGEILKNGS